MENSILQNNAKLINVNQSKELDVLSEIYNELSQKYVECENLIHTQNKI